MPNKYEEYYELAKRTEENLTRSKTNWTAFLDTAARVYKYPYSEQLLIFAQRPEATACAEEFSGKSLYHFNDIRSRGIAINLKSAILFLTHLVNITIFFSAGYTTLPSQGVWFAATAIYTP